MTRGSIREYTEAVRERYLHGSKKEKGKILKQINENLEHLWGLAEHHLHQQKKVKAYELSVT